ncbi:MAG: hypothetical protein V3W37_07875, partial [Candidatus Binatia bacterium]
VHSPLVGLMQSRVSLSIKLSATTTADQKVVWEKILTETVDLPAFGMPSTPIAKGLQTIFAEARQDLFQKLGVSLEQPGTAQEAPSSGESIDEVFKQLLEEK